MTLDEQISAVDKAGFYWAISKDNLTYRAVCSRDPAYIGDQLAYHGAEEGHSPLEALCAALHTATHPSADE